MKALCHAVLSRSDMSGSLQPMDCRQPSSFVCGDSPSNNTRMGCCALLQGIFPIQIKLRSPQLQADSLPFEPQAKIQEYWSGQLIPSLGDLPHPGIELGSPALQENSLPAELPGNPLYRCHHILFKHLRISFRKSPVSKIATDVQR